MQRLGKYSGVAMGIFVGASMATIVGVSAHGGDMTMIHACVGPSGGVRIVDASAACRGSETAVDWNVQGLKGDKGRSQVLQGPKGDPGVQGPKGDQGDTGPAGTFSGVFTSPNQAYKLSVSRLGYRDGGTAGRRQDHGRRRGVGESWRQDHDSTPSASTSTATSL